VCLPPLGIAPLNVSRAVVQEHLWSFLLQTISSIAEARVMAASGHAHKVLIIDDEHTIADTLAAIFRSAGYEARTAYSAEQAIELMAQWLPDIAIVDVILPAMNGIDLVILLKSQFPTCRSLLFSGQALTDDLLADAVTRGYTFDVLAKPVHPTVMLESALNLLTANQAKQTREVAAAGEPLPAELDPPLPEGSRNDTQ
jgi:DNA-binding NtrC family response regulator